MIQYKLYYFSEQEHKINLMYFNFVLSYKSYIKDYGLTAYCVQKITDGKVRTIKTTQEFKELRQKRENFLLGK